MPFPIGDGGRDERTAAAISVIGVGDKLKIQEMRIVWRTVSAKITLIGFQNIFPKVAG